MKKTRPELNINFWPGFSDLLISIVLMLILYLFVQEITFYLSDAYRQQMVKKTQEEFKKELKYALGADSTIIHSITEEGVNQKISFRSSFLFETGKTEFKNKQSEELIRKIGRVLQKRVKDKTISQIVVEGHTNSLTYMGDKFGNWRLSALRAVTVVKILDEMGIRPNYNQLGKEIKSPSRLISISGFAQYDYVPDETGKEDLEESKRIQFLLVYSLSK